MAVIFEVIYSEFLICRYLAMKEYQYPKTESFLCTLPYTRNMQVGSKYLIYFIVFAFCCTAYWIDTLFVPNLIKLSSDLTDIQHLKNIRNRMLEQIKQNYQEEIRSYGSGFENDGTIGGK